MIKTVSVDFSIIFFQKNYLDLTVTKQKSNIRTLRKKLGKHLKQNYNAAFSHLQKKVIPHRSKIFVSSNKESKNIKLSSKWIPFGVFTIAFHFYLPYLWLFTFFKLTTCSLSSSALIFLTPIFFSRLLGSGLNPQNCLYSQGFWALKLFNGCLVV